MKRLSVDGISRTPAGITLPPSTPSYATEYAPGSTNYWRIANWVVASAASLVVGAVIGASAYSVTHAAAAQADARPTAAAAASAAATPRISSAQLQSLTDSLATSIPATSSLSIIDLTSGATAGHNTDQQLVSASLYKLFVALAVYKAIDTGTLSASTPVASTNVEQCLNKMIAVSDNECGVALGSLVGWEKQNANLAAEGFSHTKLAQTAAEYTSAGDVAKLLQRLYAGTLLSPNSNNQFLALLKAQKINNRLPMGLPSGVTIAHKTGDLDNSVHDAGIVYANGGAYVISLMTTDWDNVAQAPATFASVSQKLYNRFEKTAQ